MKKTALFLLLASMVFCVPSVSPAQEAAEDEKSNAEEAEGPPRFWQASVAGGSYTVALDRISSVSLHEYVLDTQLRVNELVIDTNGRALARFYYVASVTENSSSTTDRVIERGKQLVEKGAERAGIDFHNLPQKNYPTTSHAGTVEFRIMELKDLKALYRSAMSSWQSGKGRRITVK